MNNKWLVIILFLLGLTSAFFLWDRSKDETPPSKKISNLQESIKATQRDELQKEVNEEPVDNENDGIYYSYKYGYQFEYPENILIDQGKVYIDETSESVCWLNEKDADGPLGLNQETGIFMCSRASKGESAESKFYDLYDADPTNSPRMGIRELEQINKDNYKQYILFAKTPEGRETEHSVAYQSGWLTNSGLYLDIFLAAGEDKDALLAQYKNDFDHIVSSVEFNVEMNN